MPSLEGSILGERYRLSKYLAEGNFGAVFQSEQLFLGVPARRVAVKVSKQRNIPRGQACEIFSDVFTLAQAMDGMRDATARSRLVHVYDAGLTDEGRAFVVMEYVEGLTLQAELHRAGRATEKQTLRWVRQIAEALAGLHQLPKGALVHRDLKPDNLLLGLDNAIRVVDFGLTARINDLGWVPGVAGATTYMAPETTRGRSLPASDIYSVGLILYQAVTGGLPFDDLAPPVGMPADKHSEWLTRQKETQLIVPPSQHNPSISGKLNELILDCLKFEVGLRPANGAALLRALDNIEKPDLRPDEAALAEGRRLKLAGKTSEAAREWERGLRVPQPIPSTQAELLSELARLSEASGAKAEALERWIQLWERVKDSGLLMPNSRQRVELLDRIIALQRESGNQAQAGWYGQVKRSLFPMAR
jgi:serine/threonine protein kinase